MTRRFRSLLVAVGFGSGILSTGVLAQEPPPDPVRAAVRLRDAGDMAGAIRLLRARVAQSPDDGDALRLLAQTFYWAKERDSAQSTYERALQRHPQDLQVRLDYARMLVETGGGARARGILVPLASSPAMRPAAETLLGTLEYWGGNLSAAVHHFRAALRADSGAVEARRQWREIAVTTAPWLRATVEAGHDDQPLDRVAPTIEAGWFITPLWSVGVRGRAPWYSAGGNTTVSVPAAEAFASGYIPQLRFETELSGGWTRQAAGGSTFGQIGRVASRIRLGRFVRLGGRAEWRPYLHTVASLETPVMVRELAAVFAVATPSGWLGESSYGRQRYPDANTITSGYAWLLVPLVSRRATVFQLGYSFSGQNAGQSRFVLANPAQPYAPTDPRFSFAGRYAPYYTPDHLTAHAAIGSLTLQSRTTSLTAGGSYAFFARDDAPVFTLAGAPPVVIRTSYRRSLEPWNGRLGLRQVFARDVTVSANAEYTRTAFYRAASLSVQVSYRFGVAAARRVDRF